MKGGQLIRGDGRGLLGPERAGDVGEEGHGGGQDDGAAEADHGRLQDVDGQEGLTLPPGGGPRNPRSRTACPAVAA